MACLLCPVVLLPVSVGIACLGCFLPGGGCPFLIRCQQFSTVAYPSVGIAPEGLDDEKLGHRHGGLE